MKYRLTLTALAALLIVAPMSAMGQQPQPDQPAAQPAAQPEQPAAQPEQPAAQPEAQPEQPAADSNAKADAPAADPNAKTDAPAADPNKPAVGPGNRPLRTDYPGHDEAMQARMETDKLKGNSQAMGGDEVYDLQVRELEAKIDDLKERVFRSKSRIKLLEETLLGGKLAGSRSVIVQRSEITGTFKLQRALYQLDGKNLLNQIDRDGALAGKETIELFNESIEPGTHKLFVRLEYQGDSTAFSYMKGYALTLTQTCQFTVEEGMATLIDVRVFRAGNVTKQVQNRPSIRCEISKTDVMAKELPKPKPKAEDVAATPEAKP